MFGGAGDLTVLVVLVTRWIPPFTAACLGVSRTHHVLLYCLTRVHDLFVLQALAKKLLGGSGVISCMAVHPGGDHVIVGSEDKRLAW